MRSGPRRRGRQLSPEEKWQVFVQVISQQLTQADAARKWGVDVSTVIKLRRLAKDGALAAFAASRPGRPLSVEQVELEELRPEYASCRRRSKELAVELSLHPEGNARLFGPVPGRVSAETSSGCGPVEARRRCGGRTARVRVLELADVRAHRWRARLREVGTPRGPPAGQRAVHRLLSWEEQAILELIETGLGGPLAPQLAHRGSYTGTVFVSPSTLLRVALKHQVQLPGDRSGPRPGQAGAPELRRSATASGSGTPRTSRAPRRLRDRRRRHALLDRLSALDRAVPTQAQLLFARALEDQDLVGRRQPAADSDNGRPILVAWSDTALR